MNHAAIDNDSLDAEFDADVLFHVALNTANRFARTSHAPADPAAPMPSPDAALLAKAFLLGVCYLGDRLKEVAALNSNGRMQAEEALRQPRPTEGKPCRRGT